MTGREPAWRVFAFELTGATVEQRGPGERDPTYLLSPLGARMNRVLLAGVLSAPTSAGRDPAQPFYRSRLLDPTGEVELTAGSVQPRALEALRRIAQPTGAIVLGKAQRYAGRDGRPVVALRAEEIRPATDAEVRAVQDEALAHTLDRIELAERLREAPDTAADAPTSSGVPRLWVESARTARTQYHDPDPARFRAALAPLFGSPQREPPATPETAPPAPPAPSPSVRRTETRSLPPPRPPRDHAQESILLELVDELIEGSEDGYADLRELTQSAASRGVGEHRLEELLTGLEEEGVLEEPIVGKLRRS